MGSGWVLQGLLCGVWGDTHFASRMFGFLVLWGLGPLMEVGGWLVGPWWQLPDLLGTLGTADLSSGSPVMSLPPGQALL